MNADKRAQFMSDVFDDLKKAEKMMEAAGNIDAAYSLMAARYALDVVRYATTSEQIGDHATKQIDQFIKNTEGGK